MPQIQFALRIGGSGSADCSNSTKSSGVYLIVMKQYLIGLDSLMA